MMFLSHQISKHHKLDIIRIIESEELGPEYTNKSVDTYSDC